MMWVITTMATGVHVDRDKTQAREGMEEVVPHLFGDRMTRACR